MSKILTIVIGLGYIGLAGLISGPLGAVTALLGLISGWVFGGFIKDKI